MVHLQGMVANRVQHKQPVIRALNALPRETLVEAIRKENLPSGGLFVPKKPATKQSLLSEVID